MWLRFTLYSSLCLFVHCFAIMKSILCTGLHCIHCPLVSRGMTLCWVFCNNHLLLVFKGSSSQGIPPPLLQHSQPPFLAGTQTPAQTYQTSHPQSEWGNLFSTTDSISSKIGHFQVPLCLYFKARLSVKLFLWEWVWFAWKWNCMQNSFSYEGFCT